MGLRHLPGKGWASDTPKQNSSMSTSESRKKYIANLGKYMEDAAKTCQKFMKSLQWTTEYLIEETKRKEVVKCPINPGHCMPVDALDRHVQTCSWIQDGYSKEEKERTNSSCYFYENSTAVVSVLIDKKTQTQILRAAAEKQNYGVVPFMVEKDVPKTMDRAITELNSAERLAIYEHVVKEGEDTNEARAIQLEDLQLSFEKQGAESKKRKSLLEMMAEERDYKRRRQSYRAKNVHITKKSYTEVMREVIENQMDMLKHMRESESGEAVSPERQNADEATARTASPIPPLDAHRFRERPSHSSMSSPVVERDQVRSPSHHRKHSKSRHEHKRIKKRRRSHDRSDEDQSKGKRHKKSRKKHRHRKHRSHRRSSRSRNSSRSRSSSSSASSSSHSTSSNKS